MSEAAADQRASTAPPETPDVYGAYPRLSDLQIVTLGTGGARRAVETGKTLVREGERCDYFFVILSGKVAVTTTDDEGNRHVIRVHGPGPPMRSWTSSAICYRPRPWTPFARRFSNWLRLRRPALPWSSAC